MLSLFHTILLFIALSAWALCISAFSTTAAGRFLSSSHHPLRQPYPTILFNTKIDEVITSNDMNYNNSTSPSSSKDKAAIIFLHGLGDSPDGWASLAEALAIRRPDTLAKLDITYVFPPANMVAITVNGGEKMPGWFDVYDWPIGVDAKDDPKGLAMSVKRIEKIVTQLKEEEGIPPSRVVLGGFSQGGAVAIMAAYNRRRKEAIPFAGCICMSGWLPMKDYLDVDTKSATTPLFWAHGQYDDKIPVDQQMVGVHKLEGCGVGVTAYAYPVGHESTSDYEEIGDMAAFIESVLCPQIEDVDDGPKYKYVQAEDSEVADLNEDETNALLYYLCALGMEDDSGTSVEAEQVSGSTIGDNW